jgi:L-aspartate oxidase
VTIAARATVLASGGAGGLWLHTSNPAGATADGIALAWNAGAALSDLEFMQFHPTVLMAGGEAHLISEAVRGEGAYLRNHAGERFMLRYSSQAELAPRDVVARAILSEMAAEQTTHQYLDLRHLPAEKMYARFPTISALCRHYGLDLAKDLLPIAPAAHYCMGGVHVDSEGRTTVSGLYAVGEVACTGVHGANRLASNSLLEGLVYGLQIADHLSTHFNGGEAASSEVDQTSTLITYQDALIRTSTCVDEQTLRCMRQELRQLMWRAVSLVRSEPALQAALQQVRGWRDQVETVSQERFQLETSNMLLAAELVIAAAIQRRESRGSHWRQDYQQTDPELAGRHYIFQSASKVTAQAREEVISHA